jgi:hypothetical protein
MPAADIGNGRVTAATTDQLALTFRATRGPVLALTYELAKVGQPPQTIERRGWNDLDFQKQNPREWRLDAIAETPGRYVIVVHASLLATNASMTVAMTKNRTAVFRRTIPGSVSAAQATTTILLTIR